MPEMIALRQGWSETVGSVPASTTGTTITGGASSNVKGSYVELTAATTRDADWVLVMVGNPSSLNVTYIDIAIGAATEQVIIPDLAAYYTAGNSNNWLFPIFIPAGSRLTARCANANSGSATINVTLTLFSASHLSSNPRQSLVSKYGTSASAGTSVDPGGTADTDSSWVQITSATDRDHHWLCLHAKEVSATPTAVSDFLLDIGTGSATEEEIISDFYYTNDATVDKMLGPICCFPYFIPTGTRVVARVRSSSIVANERALHVMIHGV